MHKAACICQKIWRGYAARLLRKRLLGEEKQEEVKEQKYNAKKMKIILWTQSQYRRRKAMKKYLLLVYAKKETEYNQFYQMARQAAAIRITSFCKMVLIRQSFLKENPQFSHSDNDRTGNGGAGTGGGKKGRSNWEQHFDYKKREFYYYNPFNDVYFYIIIFILLFFKQQTVTECPTSNIKPIKRALEYQTCVECDRKPDIWCVQCRDFYCKTCSILFHDKGKRKLHLLESLYPPLDETDDNLKLKPPEPVPTRFCSCCKIEPSYCLCNQCLDSYCLNCFKNQHTNSKSRQCHTWDYCGFTEWCSVCKTVIAKVICPDCKYAFYCDNCYTIKHRKGGKRSHRPRPIKQEYLQKDNQ